MFPYFFRLLNFAFHEADIMVVSIQAFTVINSIYYPLCEPKFSNPIRNLKNPTTGDLKITR